MTVRDEVCGMTITAEQAAATVEMYGNTYYFCSERCRRKFEEHPGWFVAVPGQHDASEAREVDDLVSNVREDGPALIEPRPA